MKKGREGVRGVGKRPDAIVVGEGPRLSVLVRQWILGREIQEHLPDMRARSVGVMPEDGELKLTKAAGLEAAVEAARLEAEAEIQQLAAEAGPRGVELRQEWKVKMGPSLETVVEETEVEMEKVVREESLGAIEADLNALVRDQLEATGRVDPTVAKMVAGMKTLRDLYDQYDSVVAMGESEPIAEEPTKKLVLGVRKLARESRE